MGLVAVGYAIGPVIIARRLSGVPALGVVAASLVLTALIYAPVGLIQPPPALGRVENAGHGRLVLLEAPVIAARLGMIGSLAGRVWYLRQSAALPSSRT